MYGLEELESLSAKNQRAGIVMILQLTVSEQKDDQAGKNKSTGQTDTRIVNL
jgi:hypothetical protein